MPSNLSYLSALLIFTKNLTIKMTHALSIVWNPPKGIDLGFITIHFYSLLWMAAFALGWFIMKKIFDREGESTEKLDKLFIYTLVATMIGARLGHVICSLKIFSVCFCPLVLIQNSNLPALEDLPATALQ